jgi:hypothetical protein
MAGDSAISGANPFDLAQDKPNQIRSPNVRKGKTCPGPSWIVFEIAAPIFIWGNEGIFHDWRCGGTLLGSLFKNNKNT